MTGTDTWIADKTNRAVAEKLVEELNRREKSGAGYIDIDEIIELLAGQMISNLPPEIADSVRVTIREGLNIRQICAVLRLDSGFAKASLARSTYPDARRAATHPLTLPEAKAQLPGASKARATVIVVDDNCLFDASLGKKGKVAGGIADSIGVDLRASRLKHLPATREVLADLRQSVRSAPKLLR